MGRVRNDSLQIESLDATQDGRRGAVSGVRRRRWSALADRLMANYLFVKTT